MLSREREQDNEGSDDNACRHCGCIIRHRAYASSSRRRKQVRLRAGRHLHHERDGLGPPLLGAGVRGLQAGRRGDGLRGGLLGHARLRHHQADRLLRAGPRQAAEGHPPAPDAGRPLHRADQPRHRKRRRDRHLRRRLAEVEARLLHHLGQPRRGQVCGRGDRRTARRQGRVRGAGEPRPEQPRPPRHRLHRLPVQELSGHEAGRPPGVQPGLRTRPTRRRSP